MILVLMSATAVLVLMSATAILVLVSATLLSSVYTNLQNDN